MGPRWLWHSYRWWKHFYFYKRLINALISLNYFHKKWFITITATSRNRSRLNGPYSPFRRTFEWRNCWEEHHKFSHCEIGFKIIIVKCGEKNTHLKFANFVYISIDNALPISLRIEHRKIFPNSCLQIFGSSWNCDLLIDSQKFKMTMGSSIIHYYCSMKDCILGYIRSLC